MQTLLTNTFEVNLVITNQLLPNEPGVFRPPEGLRPWSSCMLCCMLYNSVLASGQKVNFFLHPKIDGQITMKFTEYIHASKRSKLCNFNDPMTFSNVPPSADWRGTLAGIYTLSLDFFHWAHIRWTATNYDSATCSLQHQSHSHSAKHPSCLYPRFVLPHICTHVMEWWNLKTLLSSMTFKICTHSTYTQTESEALSVIHGLWAGLDQLLSLPCFGSVDSPHDRHTHTASVYGIDNIWNVKIWNVQTSLHLRQNNSLMILCLVDLRMYSHYLCTA